MNSTAEIVGAFKEIDADGGTGAARETVEFVRGRQAGNSAADNAPSLGKIVGAYARKWGSPLEKWLMQIAPIEMRIIE